ncbi:hypothetical protein JRQ81_000020 [Phrynocephalus forsythii]|uniref:C-type lectin domain-containing protein n=1 Tax=Phrynocephalus forsythii TaxID=171643 RepID=A0A9Q0X636_9SAUR|nr:hypothetical protein JRQ81_000020 [Phrynocephalus forsythii]
MRILLFCAKDFLIRYKTPADHWIGLRRNKKTDPWRWINNTIFNNAFPIRGRGECTYVNHEGIASSSCGREEPWICSKPPASHQRGVAPVAKPCSASSRRETTKES